VPATFPASSRRRFGLRAKLVASEAESATEVLVCASDAKIGGRDFTELGLVGVTGVNLTSIVVAAIGAIIVLVVYHAVIGRRAPA
jgi:uncharacterized membrane protein YeaQ/YmgE (transglycosylase-associated protein family)